MRCSVCHYGSTYTWNVGVVVLIDIGEIEYPIDLSTTSRKCFREFSLPRVINISG
jgi:hypothetical protein